MKKFWNLFILICSLVVVTTAFGITIVVVNKNKEKNLTYDLVYKFKSAVTGTIPYNVKLHEGE